MIDGGGTVERTSIEEFRSQERSYQVHTRAHARGYTVQVFARELPVGPRYTVELDGPSSPGEQAWDRAARDASEVLADIAKRAVGWRGVGA